MQRYLPSATRAVFAFFFALCFGVQCFNAYAQQRVSLLLDTGWLFRKGDQAGFADEQINTNGWQKVNIPHDWAIYGPFSETADLMNVAISQDGQTQARPQPGRSGGLPYVGTGIYRRIINLKEFAPGKRATLVIDGAMSHAEVWVNGKKANYWPYGYNSFFTDITPYLVPGKNNVLAIRLRNEPESSRWYPGAGLYRNVHLEITSDVDVDVWGTQITTPFVSTARATVNIKTTARGINNAGQAAATTVRAQILDSRGAVVAEDKSVAALVDTTIFQNVLTIDNPRLWDVGKPNLYTARIQVFYRGRLTDTYDSRFGVRTIEYRPNSGFYLNGSLTKFKGVCLHHDLGMLGTAINKSAVERQLRILQDMGVNAIRTSHNMPAPEFIEACDEMGIMVMPESFDEWQIAKMKNGYHKYFDEWHERDLQNLIRHYRNSPSVVMWSIGNEVYEQGDKQGAKVAYELQRICHREDPTRPVTQGLDNPTGALANNMAATMDIAGFNYRPWRYVEEYRKLPQQLILGAETASTLSARGKYQFPVVRKAMAKYTDFQSSGYDVEHCGWSDLPEDNFIMQDDLPYTIGEFVWTGFDYLGEPTPYYEDWPAHSSLFGIVDLAGIPKDRYYLYRSVWRPDVETLHILPHWTWPGKKGQNVPVFVYTNYPSAELFVNGKSQGVRRKDTSIKLDPEHPDAGIDGLNRLKRYRLMWPDVKYAPGTLKVVAYNSQGKAVASKELKTAGKPYAIRLTADRVTLKANGKDLAFVKVEVTDRHGNICPTDERAVTFNVTGAGHFVAQANGNNICIESFQSPTMHLFAGALTGVVGTNNRAGAVTVTVTAPGLKSGRLELLSR